MTEENKLLVPIYLTLSFDISETKFMFALSSKPSEYFDKCLTRIEFDYIL